MLQTGQSYSDASGSSIQFMGGANGGDGGRLLITPPNPKSTPLCSARPGRVRRRQRILLSALQQPLLEHGFACAIRRFLVHLFQATGNIDLAPARPGI